MLSIKHFKKNISHAQLKLIRIKIKNTYLNLKDHKIL